MPKIDTIPPNIKTKQQLTADYPLAPPNPPASREPARRTRFASQQHEQVGEPEKIYVDGDKEVSVYVGGTSEARQAVVEWLEQSINSSWLNFTGRVSEEPHEVKLSQPYVGFMFCKLKVSDGYTVITALPENVYRRLGSHFDSLDLANSLDLDRQDPKNLEEMMKQLAQGKLSPRDPLRNDSQREHAKAVLAAQIEADMNQFKTAIIEDPELLRLLQESPEKLDHVLEQIETQSSPDGSQTTFYKIPERKGYKLQHCCKGEVTLAFLYHDSAGLSTLANMHSFVRKCNSSSKARDQAARCLSGNDSPSTKKIGQTTVDSGNKPHTSSPQTTRGRWAWLLAGGGILILVGGAVLWLLGQRNESPEPSKPISDSKTETIGPNAHNPLQEEGTHLGPESSSLPPLPVGSPKDEQEPEEPAALMTATGA